MYIASILPFISKMQIVEQTICLAGPSTPVREKGKSVALSPQQQALQAAYAALQMKANSEERWVLPTPSPEPMLSGDVLCLLPPSWTILSACSKHAPIRTQQVCK